MTTLIPKVDFKNGGTTPAGAINRPINEKLQDFVSVKDFGATGDGITDDTLSIEAAIAYCKGTGIGATLYFPAGTYCFSETTPNFGLYISEPLTIIGDGPTKTTLKNLSATGAGVRCAAGFITISNIGIDNNNSTGIAFRMGGQYSVTHNLQIRNQAGNNFAFVADGSTLASVYDLHIIDCSNGISIAATLPTQYLTFTNVSVEITSGEGLTIGASTSIKFYGLYFEPNDATTNVTHLIKATGAIDLNFYELSAEVFGTLGNPNQAWIIFESCKTVNIFGGRISNSIASNATVFFAISGANTRNINFEGLELQSVGAGQTLFNVADSPYQISWRNISTFGSFVGVGIAYDSSGNGLSLENWQDYNQPYSLSLDSNDTFVKNVSNNISIANRTNLTFINCQGTISGSGAGNITQLDNLVSVSSVFRPKTDGLANLGLAGNRWNNVYAVNGTIITSDEREKQDVKELSESEKQVAIAIKGLIRSFKFKDAVAKKGDKARIHIGVMAQQVAEAFKTAGLNPDNYSLFCYDEWTAQIDEDGKEISPAGNRYGIRYDELLAFVISAL